MAALEGLENSLNAISPQRGCFLRFEECEKKGKIIFF